MALVRLLFKPGAFGRKEDWYINKIGADGQCDVGGAACTGTFCRNRVHRKQISEPQLEELDLAYHH